MLRPWCAVCLDRRRAGHFQLPAASFAASARSAVGLVLGRAGTIRRWPRPRTRRPKTHDPSSASSLATMTTILRRPRLWHRRLRSAAGTVPGWLQSSLSVLSVAQSVLVVGNVSVQCICIEGYILRPNAGKSLPAEAVMAQVGQGGQTRGAAAGKGQTGRRRSPTAKKENRNRIKLFKSLVVEDNRSAEDEQRLVSIGIYSRVQFRARGEKGQ